MDTRSLARLLDPILRPLRQRITMLVSRAILEAVNDATGIQLVKVSLFHEETRENVERIQNFGFTSNPPLGAEALAIFAGGNREHGFIIGCDARTIRMKNLASGETAIYTDDGTYIHLKKNGEVKVLAATKVQVDAPLVEFTGNAEIAGNVEVTGTVTASNVFGGGTNLAAVKSGFNTHTHAGGTIPPPDVPLV